MARYVALSRQRHAGLSWNRPTDYGFAADRPFVGIVGPELAPAATNMPLAFIKDGEALHLVGLLSWNGGSNLFVGADGGWLAGTYIPAMFRTHPFRLLRETDEKLTLCVDEESGLVLERGGKELFFEDEGQPSKAVSDVLRILEIMEKSRSASSKAVSSLDAAGVIVPWEATHSEREGRPTPSILFRIDEARLRSLDDDKFLELRKAGALSIAYAQLISLSRLDVLARLSEYRDGKKNPRVLPSSTLGNILAQSSDETLRFD